VLNNDDDKNSGVHLSDTCLGDLAVNFFPLVWFFFASLVCHAYCYSSIHSYSRLSLVLKNLSRVRICDEKLLLYPSTWYDVTYQADSVLPVLPWLQWDSFHLDVVTSVVFFSLCACTLYVIGDTLYLYSFCTFD